MNRILITGGAGFIGSHLAEVLVSKGYDVTVIDNLSTGQLNNLKNIASEAEFINGGITNFELIKNLIKKSEAVFHLAAVSRVMASIKDPELCFNTNIAGTEIIARLCSKFNKKLIFSSSREVYGNVLYLPVDEGHPLDPCNPYGVSKVSGEKIINFYSKHYGLEYAILRITNAYGPRDFGRVIPIFIKKASKNENLVVYGKEKILDFIYVDEVVDAFLRVLNSENLIINIGSGKGTRITELAKIIKETTGSKSKIIIKGNRTGEVEKFTANIEKAKKILKWKPKITLENGIRCLLKECSR